MHKNPLIIFTQVVCMGVSLFVLTNPAHASTVPFTNITNNSSIDLSGQLSVDVTQSGTDAYFTFWNDADSLGSTWSSITDIYFDYDINNVTGMSIFEESSGVGFSGGAAPPNLPGGNSIGFVSDYSADSDPKAIAANGVDNTGEYITFLASLASGYDILSALYDGSFAIGLHIQAINDGFDNSDSYVSTVPVPAAAWLFGTALIGFMVSSRRRKSS